MPQGIRDGVELAVVEDLGAGVEPLEIKGIVVEKLPSFGVSSDKDLEATVESEAIDVIGADAAADGVGGFEEEVRDVKSLEAGGGGQAGKAGADNEDGGFVGGLGRRVSVRREVECRGWLERMFGFVESGGKGGRGEGNGECRVWHHC